MIKVVGDRFVNEKERVTRWELVKSFQSPKLLDRLIRLGVLNNRTDSDNVIPFAIALFYCDEPTQ
jgi:hypothetical protein